MRRTPRLALRREELTELAADDLARAVAGEHVPPTSDCSLKVVQCFSLEPRCSWSCPV